MTRNPNKPTVGFTSPRCSTPLAPDQNDKAVCAWCGDKLTGLENSHGICWDCILEYFPEYVEEMKEESDG